jgi:hypothetical protein
MAEKQRNSESIYSTFCTPTALSLAFPIDFPLAAWKNAENIKGNIVKTIK